MTDLLSAAQDPPWSENPPPVVAPEVEEWSRALCIADGAKPDKLVGCPEWPRWHSYATFAVLAIKARDIIAARS